MFLLGVMLFFLLVAWAIVSSGLPLFTLMDAGTLVFSFAAYFCLLLMTSSLKEFAYGFKLVISKNSRIEKYSVERIVSVYDFLIKSSLGVTVIGVIIGIVALLHYLGDPSAIGPTSALILLMVFYNVIFVFFLLLPIKYNLKKSISK